MSVANKPSGLDGSSLSLIMTDILQFQKKQISGPTADQDNDILSVCTEGNTVELFWTAKDMCPRYRNTFADCWLRHHEAELRAFFIQYHMEAVYNNMIWKVKLSRPLASTKPVHTVKYL